jgi:hypothetical protein
MNSTIRTEVKEQNKSTLVAAMKQYGINRIEVTFDGSGDDGQMEDVSIFDKESKINNDYLENACEVAYTKHIASNTEWIYEKVVQTKTLQELAEEVAYIPLEDHFDGWEINEGSYGVVTIHADGTGEIECNERIIDINQQIANF